MTGSFGSLNDEPWRIWSLFFPPENRRTGQPAVSRRKVSAAPLKGMINWQTSSLDGSKMSEFRRGGSKVRDLIN